MLINWIVYYPYCRMRLLPALTNMLHMYYFVKTILLYIKNLHEYIHFNKLVSVCRTTKTVTNGCECIHADLCYVSVIGISFWRYQFYFKFLITFLSSFSLKIVTLKDVDQASTSFIALIIAAYESCRPLKQRKVLELNLLKSQTRKLDGVNWSGCWRECKVALKEYVNESTEDCGCGSVTLRLSFKGSLKWHRCLKERMTYTENIIYM